VSFDLVDLVRRALDGDRDAAERSYNSLIYGVRLTNAEWSRQIQEQDVHLWLDARQSAACGSKFGGATTDINATTCDECRKPQKRRRKRNGPRST
jgi:hypothetical protein